MIKRLLLFLPLMLWFAPVVFVYVEMTHGGQTEGKAIPKRYNSPACASVVHPFSPLFCFFLSLLRVGRHRHTLYACLLCPVVKECSGSRLYENRRRCTP